MITTTLEFSLDGRNFRAQRLNARQQFHLSRRLAPLLPPIAQLLTAKTDNEDGFFMANFLGGSDEGRELTTAQLGKLMELVEPVTHALAAIKDEDADKIFEETLSSVQVESPNSPGTWLPVWVSKGNASLIPELNDFPTLVPIIIRVVVFNLGNFIPGLPTRRGEPKPQTAPGAPSPMVKTG